MGWRRGPFGGSKTCRTRACISPDLALIRFYRTSVKKPEARGEFRSGSFGQMARGTRRRRAPVREEALDDAVLEGMEGDYHEPAASFQQPLGCGKTACELLELLVEIKTERLEGPRRGVLGFVALAAEHARHDVRQFFCRLYRRFSAVCDNGPSDCARTALLTEFADDLG